MASKDLFPVTEDNGVIPMSDWPYSEVKIEDKEKFRRREIDGKNILIKGANYREFDFEYSILKNLIFEQADFQNANFAHVKLSNVNLTGANLSGANLTNAELSDVILTGANLFGVDLSGSDLSGVNLKGVKLFGVRFDQDTKWPADFQFDAKVNKIIE
jgi:uncharacterized protein YjbI with pentapeptide repeats